MALFYLDKSNLWDLNIKLLHHSPDHLQLCSLDGLEFVLWLVPILQAYPPMPKVGIDKS